VKKIIKLTESDLTRIVQRVISESDKNLITESIVYAGVKMYPTNTKGGPIILSYKGKKTKYRITATVVGFSRVVYEGLIAVVSIWKEDGVGYFIKDNTNKVFKIELDELDKMAEAAKNNKKQITIAGTGEMSGFEGTYTAKLTQTT